jgi:hypothetical protein
MWFKDLIVTGGPGMFAILLCGALALLTAGWFAWRVEGRVRSFLDGMARTLLYASLTALAADVARTLAVATTSKAEERAPMVLAGLSESMSPLILGFSLLALVHFLTAIGRRRLDGRRS